MRFVLPFVLCSIVAWGCGGKLGTNVVTRSKMLYVAKRDDSRIHCFDLEIDPDAEPEEGEEVTEKWPMYRVGTSAPILAFALAPNMRWLFAINDLGGVEMFESRFSGRLNRLTSPIIPAGDATKASVVTPGSTAVYFATDAGKVFGFGIGESGATTPGTPGGVPGASNPSFAIVRPDGKALYVADTTAGKIWQYEILPAGGLQPLSPASVDVAGGPQGMFWNAGSSRLYVSCTESDQVVQFSTVPGGQIAETSRVAGPGHPGVPVLDLNENFLFVPSNDGSGDIWRYQASSSLVALTPPRQTNHEDQIETRLSGQDVFVLNDTDDSFSTYRVLADGTLTLQETVELLTHPVATAYRRLP